LGFAPDAYFQSHSWGEGSLVNHLRSLGFSAAEIVEAGLAIESKGSNRTIGVTKFNNNDDEKSDEFQLLMDRFRSRIIIPIFDERGENVIAFGARILPALGNTTNHFKPPKYLNSPETPVFSKKRELFGLSTAKRAMEGLRTRTGENSKRSAHRSMVIVEGYMDAVALWEAGVHEVVASMGTALTIEQLDKAAKLAGSMGVRIVLCLDNDDAGIAAVERLCSSLILSKICEKHVVEIAIASLPDNIKDPGEYFESKFGDGDAFRHQVLDCATEWSRWHTDIILSRYDSRAIQGGPSSFADICERVSDFLATFPNPIDRTRRAYEFAVKLARAIDANSTSNTLQIQLESDLVNMVARKAAAKEVLERRVESVEGYKSQNNTMIMKRMLEGGLSVSTVKTSKLARNATKGEASSDNVIGFNTPKSGMASNSPPNQEGNRNRLKRNVFRREPLIPHFAGVEIRQSSDASWLGVPQDRSRRELHHLTFGAPSAEGSQKGKRRQSMVFFNSNDFHGDQFLTKDAEDAGYAKGMVVKDSALLEKGIGVLISDDQEYKGALAEQRLLRNLVLYPSARSAMRDAVSTSDATGASPEIDWSSTERAWLFHILVAKGNNVHILDERNPQMLWKFLSNRHDAPVGAFGTNPFGVSSPADFPASQVFTESDPPFSVGIEGDIRHVALESSVLRASEIQVTSVLTTPWDHGDDIDSLSASYGPTMFHDAEKTKGDATIDSNISDLQVVDTVLDVILTATGLAETEETGETICGEWHGPLDDFFIDSEDDFIANFDEAQRSFRAELEVQEALADLLRASAARKLSNVNSNWLIASRLLDSRLGVETDDSDVVSGIEELDSMNIGSLKLYCQSLLTRLQQLYDAVRRLDESAKRISTRLMECSQGDSTEGRISSAKQEQLSDEIEEFLNMIPDDYEPAELDSFVDPMYTLSLYGQTGEGRSDSDQQGAQVVPKHDREVEQYHFQRDMEAIDASWGEMNHNEYVWSMPDDDVAAGRSLPLYSALEEFGEEEFEEPLEEAIARMDADWGRWDIDSSNSRLPTGSSNLIAYDPTHDDNGDQPARHEGSIGDGEGSLDSSFDSQWE
jgi:DNA primase catalytic core